jgi:RHS repeat-associated protein
MRRAQRRSCPTEHSVLEISTQVNDSARKIRVMLAAAKEKNFSAPMVWTDACVLPLAARGVYPKTRIGGSSEKTLHCFSATAPLRIELRWGCENSSGETALGSALDSNGNTQTKVVGSNTTSYAWDFENRMTSVTLPGSGGTVTFAYDPFGRRIKKVTSTTTSVFAYDGDNLIEETNSSGAAVARYEPTQNIDEPLAMLRSGATSYFHADGLGSVTSLSNAAGSIANTYIYDSFGKLTASTGSLVNPFQYTARESDAETGLYYYRARYYDPTAGRFLSEDPIRFAGSINFYTYVSNKPVLRIDPTGLIHQAPDGRLHDDAAGGLEVLCTKGRNIQQDIGWLQQSIFVRFMEIVEEGDNADLGHINRLVWEAITLANCKEMCKDQPKPQPEPVPDNVNEQNWWQHILNFVKQNPFLPIIG